MAWWGGGRTESGRGAHQLKWAKVVGPSWQGSSGREGFWPRSKWEIEMLFYLIWILFKQFQFEFELFLNGFES
jgi:hypothetical protein